jgi:hypothetical protein
VKRLSLHQLHNGEQLGVIVSTEPVVSPYAHVMCQVSLYGSSVNFLSFSFRIPSSFPNFPNSPPSGEQNNMAEGERQHGFAGAWHHNEEVVPLASLVV